MMALPDDEQGPRAVEAGMEFRAMRALNAMVRPQHLGAVRNLDGLEWLAASMRRGERQVTRRMPVLRQHHVCKALRQPIDDRHDLVAAWHCQLATWTKIVLQVDDQKHVAGAGYD